MSRRTSLPEDSLSPVMPSSPEFQLDELERPSRGATSSRDSGETTPATSVMGDFTTHSKPSPSGTTLTRSSRTAATLAMTRMRSQSGAADHDDHDDPAHDTSTEEDEDEDERRIGEDSSGSDLSEMEEVKVGGAAMDDGEGHSTKRTKTDTGAARSQAMQRAASYTGSSSPVVKRGPSPEVVVYVNGSSSSSLPGKGKKRARDDADASPGLAAGGGGGGFLTAKQLKALQTAEKAAKAEMSDSLSDLTSEDEVPLARTFVRKVAPTRSGVSTSRKGKAKQESEDEQESASDSDKDSVVLVKTRNTRSSKPKHDVKGKGRKVDSDQETGGKGADSDFELDSVFNESESSAVMTDSDSDLSDVEGGRQSGAPAAAVNASRRIKKIKNAKKQRKLTWWEKNDLAMQKYHPELTSVWEDLAELPIITPVKQEQPPGLSLKLLPFQQEGLYWMLQQEKGPWKGGMLADEMGMGKTIQTISLILSDHNPKQKKHTLILAPTVAIMQWRNEFNKFTNGLKVCVWHGGNRSNDIKELLKFDIVLTSYAVLESAFRRQNQGYKRKGELLKEQSVLHSIPWHRVILDEAHNIKDRSCNTARGAFALKAEFKWCLSGTPLQNRVGELYSLIRFIGVEPFAYYFCKKCPCKSLHWKFSNKRTCDDCGHTPMHHICYWNNEILKPIQKYGATAAGHGSNAFKKLTLLLQRMMLRRTKVERADDMGLPPRDIKVRRDYFTEEEEEFYSSLYTDVKRQFSTYVAADSLLNNYANVFQLLTRMRQTACHPDLVLKGKTAKALLGDAASSNLSISTCRICLDEGEDPIMSRCKHVFCRDCIRQYLETAAEWEPECPVCHLPITIDLNQDTHEELIQARQGMLEKIDPGKWRTSTKIEALVEELSKLKTEDSSIKCLVFSQFTSFLDLIARRLQLAGFKIARLQGNMTPEARDRTVKHFMNTTDCTVFLLSLKAGGVALNLTEASRVFIMDPWWNPAAELQGMDRIHRIGQHRPVIVKRLIIENSIESKIVELQKKKSEMIGATLGDDDQALGRLTPEDLAFLFVM